VEPNDFVAEVYRRMSARHTFEKRKPTFSEIENDSRVVLAVSEYSQILPAEKAAAILDVGFGEGWFLAACLKLGYSNLVGADFGIDNKGYVRNWAPDRITLSEIETNIGDFLSNKPSQFDFIHMSHVIEHIPKYSLLWVVDALFQALKKDGVLLLRTPNMEGPTPNSSLYVTLTHEYGFCGSNLKSLLDICGFDEVTFHRFSAPNLSLKQRVGDLLRWPFLKESKIRHRLFGVNVGGQFGTELIATARRGDFTPLLSQKCR
jgi:2-polyprenyl-3-methyl-5-hydroxy-6-metoxy-1,4-benzoquinol methylase